MKKKKGVSMKGGARLIAILSILAVLVLQSFLAACVRSDAIHSGNAPEERQEERKEEESAAPAETDPVTEAPTEAPTEKPTEPPTEAPTELEAEAPETDPSETEAPETEAPETEPPTEAPTEAPTETPTEPPTEAPTEPPTEAPHAVQIEGKVNGKHYIGQTLSATDFTIKVTMSDGSVLTNPNGWQAEPLKLDKAETEITLRYGGAESKIKVSAEEAAAAPSGSSSNNTVVTENWPLVYRDATCTITIYKEQYAAAVVFAAHLQFTNYSRFGTVTGYSTVAQAYAGTGAILCINGDYSTPCGYRRARCGTVLKDGSCYAVGLYNAHNGKLFWGDEGSPTGGKQLSSLVANGIVTDTFQFGPAFLRDGAVRGSNGGSRRPRTFIGTNGAAGDIWLCVANGDGTDGVSAGLTSYECAAYLASKGCTFGFPMDGGGSSEMIFMGRKLTSGGGRGGLYDFTFFR